MEGNEQQLNVDVEKYFIIFPDNPNLEPTTLRGTKERANQNAGLLTVLWGEVKYPINFFKGIEHELVQNIFGQEGAFSHDIMKPFFSECDIWEVNKIAFELPVYSLYGSRLTELPSNLTLTFSEDTLIKFKRLFEDFPVTSEAVFRGLTSTHWEHVFLELYRCIERLYHIPFIKELCNSMGNIYSTSDLARLIDRELTWHPNEEIAIIRLLKSLGIHSIIDEFMKTFTIPEPVIILDAEKAVDQNEIARAKYQSLSQTIAKEIYKLRNNIAHWRPIGDGNTVSNWENLVSLTCDLVIELYNRNYTDL